MLSRGFVTACRQSGDAAPADGRGKPRAERGADGAREGRPDADRGDCLPLPGGRGDGCGSSSRGRAAPRGWDDDRRPRAFTVSLTSQPDSLEQWRAYCPRSGGLALGFSATHLDLAADDQGYLLAPCEYNEDSQLRIVGQILDHHSRIWNRRQSLETRRQGISSHLVLDFLTDLDRFAPLLKHPSFEAEREWRLISQPAFE